MDIVGRAGAAGIFRTCAEQIEAYQERQRVRPGITDGADHQQYDRNLEDG